MANPRPRLSDAKAKEVRDELVDNITSHQRNIGRLPNVVETEQFVDREVMRVIEVDHEADRNADMMRPSVGPKMKSALADPSVRITHGREKQYLVNQRTGQLLNLDGTPAKDPRGDLFKPDTTVGDDDIPAWVVQHQLQKLKADPKWDAEILKIWLAPHTGDCTLSKPCGIAPKDICAAHAKPKVDRILGIVRQSFGWPGFEDPRKPAVPKIIVSG